MSKRQLMALLSLAGLFLGVYLTMYHYGIIGSLACNVGSCEKVQNSRWSMFLGVPVATWGVGFYVAMLALSIAGMQERYEDSRTLSLLLVGLTGWGVLFTAWLNYLEGFVIHAWCEFCIGSAILVLLLFTISVFDLRDRTIAEEPLFDE